MLDKNAALRKLIEKTGIPLKKLAEGLGVSSIQILHWYNTGEEAFKNSQIEQLAKLLGIGTESIFDEGYDANLVRRRIYDGPLVLPEVYSSHAESHIRTSAHIIDFLKFYYGQAYVDRLLIKMGVHPRIFEGLDNKINLRFFCDLLTKLKETKDPTIKTSKLAHIAPLFWKETEFVNPFKLCKSYEEVYRTIEKNTFKLDKNFDYKVVITQTGVRILASPSEILLNLLAIQKGKYLVFKEIYNYRRHLVGCFPLLSDLEPLEVAAVKAIYLGDSHDEYFIEFPQVKRSIHIVREISPRGEEPRELR